MNRPSLRWLAGAALAGLTATALVAPAAQAAPAPAAFCADGSTPMVPQDEVTSTYDGSTTVTGLTVTQGTTPTQFTGTYAGHIEDALGTDASGEGVDLLLFELSGAGIDSGDVKAGIWAGMSGSPVYDQDGRLIGAVAYGLSPSNIRLAGVTPAGYMKQVGTDKLKGAPAKVKVTKANLEGASRRTAAAVTGATAQQLKTVKVIAGGAKGNAVANRTQARVPATSPAAKSVRAGGFAAIGAPAQIADPLVPGGNIAVGYSTGSLFSGGVGTVTAVCGDQVWAFGHPMDFAGETSLSMHNASTALIVRDDTGVSGSYKQVARVGQQIGTITEDGYAAIRGTVGLIRGFPVATTVKNAQGKVLKRYTGRVVNPLLASNAALGPVLGAVDFLDNAGTGTARLSWRIDYRLPGGHRGQLSNAQVYSGQDSLLDELAGDLGNDIYALAGTDLADVTITGVTTSLTLLDRRDIDYRVAGAQVWNGRTWVTLKGRTLAKHRTYSVRPLYRTYVNGKPKTVVPGTRTTFRMGRLAAGRGSVTFAPRGAGSTIECFDAGGGQKICIDFGDEDEEDEGDDEEYRNFGELLTARDALVRADRADVVAEWGWKGRKSKGTAKRRAAIVAPGVVSGSYKATFRIKR
ncbi:hypothetical protein [Aeromicrobium sp. 179-A 4D2 NHS]|uniref:hypothetical protein n=1 Tax=Aeromicrobium sp. 179-A 4D2 NHS TaxID=3142375 RepID=UPI0039A10303